MIQYIILGSAVALLLWLMDKKGEDHLEAYEDHMRMYREALESGDQDTAWLHYNEAQLHRRLMEQ
jgi:hypothetical protein